MTLIITQSFPDIVRLGLNLNHVTRICLTNAASARAGDGQTQGVVTRRVGRQVERRIGQVVRAHHKPVLSRVQNVMQRREQEVLTRDRIHQRFA
ncbi:hypothetical protein D3C87_1968990 [compost metagenome]